MKKNKAWLFLSMFAVAVACQDDDETTNSITTEEAAIIVSSSLASNTSGVSFVSGKSSNVTEDLLADNAGGRIAACHRTWIYQGQVLMGLQQLTVTILVISSN